MNCSFVRAENGVRCTRCGLTLITSDPPERCHAVCDAGPCRHLGPSTRTADCPTCQGRVQLKIFACELHAECTLQKKLGSIACCANCGDFQEKEVSDASLWPE